MLLFILENTYFLTTIHGTVFYAALIVIEVRGHGELILGRHGVV